MSRLTVFFNLREFALVNLLLLCMSSAAAYFIDNVIIPLADPHAQQRGDIARRKLHLPFENFRCHTA
jgi:hypothetical protein